MLKYDKASGERLGEFPAEKPGPMATDPAGRLWIVRGETQVVVLDVASGQERGRPVWDLGKIVGLSFAPAAGCTLPTIRFERSRSSASTT